MLYYQEKSMPQAIAFPLSRATELTNVQQSKPNPQLGTKPKQFTIWNRTTQLVLVFCLFCYLVICLMDLREFFIYSEYESYDIICNASIFSQSMAWLCTLLMEYFDEENFLILMKSNLSTFSFMVSDLGSNSTSYSSRMICLLIKIHKSTFKF